MAKEVNYSGDIIATIGLFGGIIFFIKLIVDLIRGDSVKGKAKEVDAIAIGVCFLFILVGATMNGSSSSDGSDVQTSQVIEVETEQPVIEEPKVTDSVIEDKSETPIVEKEVKGDITYRVAKRDDDSLGSTYRFSWHAVVSGKPTTKELEDLSEQIIVEAKKELDFNAVMILYYDYEEFIGSGSVLGMSEYAPKGDWGKAKDVKTGQYRKMKFTHKMYEKNWGKQLHQRKQKFMDFGILHIIDELHQQPSPKMMI